MIWYPKAGMLGVVVLYQLDGLRCHLSLQAVTLPPEYF